MATEAEHRVKAEHNLKFLRTVDDQYPDWLATVAFYTAVHWIEMLFAKRGIHSQDHFTRKKAVSKEFPSLKHAYNDLYNASMVARYDPQQECFPVSEVRSRLIDGRLDHITKFIASHL